MAEAVSTPCLAGPLPAWLGQLPNAAVRSVSLSSSLLQVFRPISLPGRFAIRFCSAVSPVVWVGRFVRFESNGSFGGGTPRQEGSATAARTSRPRGSWGDREQAVAVGVGGGSG